VTKEYNKAYYAANREKMLEASRLWHKQNKRYRPESYFAWREANKERIREYQKQWKIDNRDRFLSRLRDWQKRNHHKLICSNAARKAKTRGGDCSSIYRRCRELRKYFDVVVDHIMPLSKGGSHIPSNLQIIYAFENAIKSARTDYRPKVIFA
jgi:hypothetical protein